MSDNSDSPHKLNSDQRRKLRADQDLRRQAQEAGCFGLVRGSAFSVRLRRDVSADEATHADDPFICRGCLSDAVLRKCTEKCHHYAHHAGTSPAIAAGETALHQGCLREICATLAARYPEGNWAINREIPPNKERGVGKVVPDISGRIGGPNGQRLVIEAQVSDLSIGEIIKRSTVYSKRGIPILWIIPLRDEWTDSLFRPRLYERYLHSIYYGRAYYWKAGFGTNLMPVHFGVAERHIPFSEWYDKEAEEEREAGGYDKPYKVIRRPVLGKIIDIVSEFGRKEREEFRPWNERKTVPPLVLWKDLLEPWWDQSEDEKLRNFREDNLPETEAKDFRAAQKILSECLFRA